MSFIHGGEPIIIKRRTQSGEDAHGNPSYTVANVLVREALIAIGTTSESIDVGRDAVDAEVTLYLPNGTVVLEGDKFLIRDTLWEKAGTPQEWVSPFPGGEGGVVVPLRRRRG